MSESPDTQAEAVCAARRCTDVGYVKTEADGLLWCNRHALGYQRIYGPTPSAEPDGEACTCTRAVRELGGRSPHCELHCPTPVRVATPAQDGAEVEALADLIHPYMRQLRDRGDYIVGPAAQEAAEDVAGWLAQRDKDRDAAVAAKAWDEGYVQSSLAHGHIQESADLNAYGPPRTGRHANPYIARAAALRAEGGS